MFQPADGLSLTLFLLLSLLVSLFYFFGLIGTDCSKKWIYIFLGYIAIVSFGAITGGTAAFAIPVAPLFMVVLMILALSFSFSNSGLRLIQQTPLYILVGFQGMRLPLELLLHHWAKIGTIPETMTWTGSNFDILAGGCAIGFMFFVKKDWRFSWFPQIVGFLLLLNVFRVVIMSSPFPFSWHVNPPLELIFHFPYALVVPLFVLPAFIGHILVFRYLFTKCKSLQFTPFSIS